MLMNRQSQFLQKKITHAVLLVLLACFPFTANAIVIEGTIKGVIGAIYSEGEKPRTPFFDLAQEGKVISADFWYEFDENNFLPTSSSDSHREYDFGFSDMGMVFRIGTETLSVPLQSKMKLFSYRNLIGIFRTPFGDRFDLLSGTTYGGNYFDDDILSGEIFFNDEVMSYFNGFDLIQNLSLATQDGTTFGGFAVTNYGVDKGHYYDIHVTGDFNEFTIGARNSTVDESSSIGLLAIALLILGWRYSANSRFFQT